MKRTHLMQAYVNDRLVQRWRDPLTKEIFHQGKRVSKDCPLTKEEIRAYVTGGTVAAVKLIKDTRGLGLAESYDLLKSAR